MKRLIALCLTLALAILLTLQTFAQESFFSQAPMLDALVASGSLPPVDERLPQNPVVITPVEQVGVYGGTWDIARIRNDYTMLSRYLQYEGLVRWDTNWTRVIPNLAQSVDVNDDSTVFTFYLREGVRWSDGALFTADDLLFWYEDIYLKPELKETHPIFLNGMEDDFTFEKVDDYTVTFRFNAPFGMFLQQMATMSGAMMTVYPKHYLSQFHPDYNPNIADLIAAEAAADWVELFNKHRTSSVTSMHPGTPALFAWVFEEDTQLSDTVGDTFTAVRNPFYWKIDTNFNQLPYIDQVDFHVVENGAGVLAAAVNGNVGMQDRGVPPSAFNPENMQAGGYSFFTLQDTMSTPVAIFFNQTSDDPVKREIYQNRDFRIAMSYAINRPAIVETVQTFRGVEVAPHQFAPIAGSAFFDETAATQFTEYNVDLANEHLDKAGYTERDASGFRLGPDGNPIQFSLVVADPYAPYADVQPIVDHLINDWLAIGIQATPLILPRLESDERIVFGRAGFNQYDAIVWGGSGGYDVLFAPESYAPLPLNFFAPRWGVWYSDISSPMASEPPADVQRQFSLQRQLVASASEEEQNALMREILDISAARFNVIGTVSMPPSRGIVRNDFHNVPEFVFASWTYPNPAPINPSQFYIDPQN